MNYERAVALLGYTHGALLDEVVDAIGDRDAAGVFAAVDRVIQTGQDPRRFVEDLLERVRDLIIVAATSGNAQAVLRGVPQDQLDHMARQATTFGTAELSRAADVVNSALTEMTGATSPRLHLELMVARILVPASDDSERGALARVERLERRVGVEGAAVPAVAPAPAPAQRVEPVEPPVQRVEPVETAPAKVTAPVGPVTLQQVRDAWPEVLDAVEKAKRTAWMVVYTAKPLELRDGNVLVLSFPSQNDVDALKQRSAPGEGVGDHLKKAMRDILGIEPGLIARVDAKGPDAPVAAVPATADAPPAPAAPLAEEPPAPTDDDAPSDEPEPPAADSSATDSDGWAVAAIPGSQPVAQPGTPAKPEVTGPAARAASPSPKVKEATADSKRYGESVVRELLGASFIEEEAVKPRVVPQPRDD